MASRTADEIASMVIRNIGNRASGKIGGDNVRDAILDFVRNAVEYLAARENIPPIYRRASLSINTANYIYDLPVVDTDSQTIRIKHVLRVTALREGETRAYVLEQLSPRRRDALFPRTSTDVTTGRLQYYTIFGEDEIEVYPYPDVNHELSIRCTVWPTRLASLSTRQPFPEQWDIVIEAFATYYAFAALQLNEDANWWAGEAEKRLYYVLQASRENPDWEPALEPSSDSIITGPDPALNPFLGR